jgi:hypothetical protein
MEDASKYSQLFAKESREGGSLFGLAKPKAWGQWAVRGNLKFCFVQPHPPTPSPEGEGVTLD